jgi:ATP-dependent DNA helicase DinG
VTVAVEELLAPAGAVARRLEGYERRPQQAEMAAAVARAMAARGRLIVEAGTGVGKSFAYLIPAIQRIVEHGERVVVATHTINLQEQLIEKDVPLLRAVIPGEFSAVLAIGRNNYVSLRRLALAGRRQAHLFDDGGAVESLHALEQWAGSTTDGTRATLPRLPRPDVWDHAQSDTHNCMGRRCPTFEACFYQKARRRVQNGQLIVCNHALFFSDLALRRIDASVLPDYQHVVLDEAHAVEDVAAQHFGLDLSEARVLHLLNLLHQPRSGRGFLATVLPEGGAGSLPDQAVRLVEDCRGAARELFGDLWAWHERQPTGHNGRLRAPGAVTESLGRPMRELAGLLKLLRERVSDEPDKFELASYAERAAAIAREADAVVGQTLPGHVYWVELMRRRAGGERPLVAARSMPVEVAPTLREALFAGSATVVLTSATLATGPGDFSHLARSLGCDEAATLQVGSPFDHATQMKVIVDRTMPAPDGPGYAAALVPRILQQVRATHGGAFVLFTSFAMLERVAGGLGPILDAEGYPVLVQERDGRRSLLLQRFRENERSVLLGTSSFWQGVDVRGRALRNVIITKLPFDVPDLPLLQARQERIRERGGDPFLEELLPKAVIRFKQGVGRLIRSSTDTGRIVVLDPRIATRAYGRRFLEALPEGVRVEEVDEFLPPA